MGGNVTAVNSLVEWRELLSKGGLVMVDCYATWCPPCKVGARAQMRMRRSPRPCPQVHTSPCAVAVNRFHFTNRRPLPWPASLIPARCACTSSAGLTFGHSRRTQAAAPVYARMSEEFTSVTFAKVNVDEVRDVAKLLGISAMPTFKLFRGETELGTQRGWSESAVRKMLVDAGATSSPPAPKTD